MQNSNLKNKTTEELQTKLKSTKAIFFTLVALALGASIYVIFFQEENRAFGISLLPVGVSGLFFATSIEKIKTELKSRTPGE